MIGYICTLTDASYSSRIEHTVTHINFLTKEDLFNVCANETKDLYNVRANETKDLYNVCAIETEVLALETSLHNFTNVFIIQQNKNLNVIIFADRKAELETMSNKYPEKYQQWLF